jgi:predicted membrane protein
MYRLGFGFVFGAVVLVIGASVLIEVLFGIHFPLVPLVIGIALAIWGSRMMIHALARRDRYEPSGEAWLADREFAPAGALERDARYDVVFGRGLVDLTHVVEPAGDVTVAVGTVFGTTVVKVDPAIAYDVEGRSMFGEIRMPDRTMAAMGNVSYHKPSDHPPRLHLRLHTVFGACQVIETG